MPEFILPWPPSELSPNGKGASAHWATKANAKKKYKEECYYQTFSLGIKIKYPKDTTIPLSMVFHPPTKHSYDLDNLLARMKSGIDGMAAAWGINDKRFRPITVDVGEVFKGGKVVVKV